MQSPISHTSNSTANPKYIPKCISKYFHCPKKKKNQKGINDSELNSILQKNKNLLKLDNSKLNNQQSINSPFRNKGSSPTKKTSFSPLKLPSALQCKIRYKTQNSNLMSIPIKKKIQKEEKHFFHEFKDKLRCIFCGGKKCKHENYKTNLNNNNAIEGLNSNFITENIIASQRPSEKLIQKYNLIQKFKTLNIGLIVNLQREGEHPYCGPNAFHLTSSGYSYNPSVFTGDDIKCKFSGWKDMEIPSSMNFMLDIVKEMSIVTHDEKAKVLVHCHAGYGRTGVVIVCYLLFNSIKDSDSIIKEVREKRKKCVETNRQINYCKKFENFLNHSRILFGDKESIDVYLRRQEDLLFGNEYFKYGFVPKIIIKVLEKIIELNQKFNYDKVMIYKVIEGIIIDWNDELENELLNLKNLINKGDWDSFDKNNNLIVIIELLFDWFEDCVDFVISRERTEKIISSDLYNDFFFNINGKKKEKLNQQILKQRKNLFDYIKRIYHCFEYEIIFSFATFLITIQPITEQEQNLFDSMLGRISIGLLGFSYSDANNNEEYNKSIFFLYSGLSSILKLICDSIINNVEEDSYSIISPVRKNCPVKYNLTEKENIPFGLSLDNILINDRRKSYILQRALHTMLSNPRISLNSSNNFFTPKILSKNITLIKENYNHDFQILHQYYSNKNLIEEPEVPSFYLNSPSEIPTYPDNFKRSINIFSTQKDLCKVEEEVNSKNSSINVKNNCDIFIDNINNDYSNGILNFDINKIDNDYYKYIQKEKKNNKKESMTTTTTDNRKSLINLNKKNSMQFNFDINKKNSIKMRGSMRKDNNNYSNIISENGNNVLNNYNKNNQNEGIINLVKCMNN